MGLGLGLGLELGRLERLAHPLQHGKKAGAVALRIPAPPLEARAAQLRGSHGAGQPEEARVLLEGVITR